MGRLDNLRSSLLRASRALADSGLESLDGLASDNVNAITPDSRGWLWFSTDEGLLPLALLLNVQVFAADPAGTWRASFDTQIGTQNYVYTFSVDGGKRTGTAKSQFGEAEILEGSIKDGDISFVENIKFQDMQIRIE